MRAIVWTACQCTEEATKREKGWLRPAEHKDEDWAEEQVRPREHTAETRARSDRDEEIRGICCEVAMLLFSEQNFELMRLTKVHA